jgi:Uma2 family endonuclease
MVAEIVEGELHTRPRPDWTHAAAATGLTGLLSPRFHFRDGLPGGWYLLQEPALRFQHDVLIPDMAGWRRARLPRDEDDYSAVSPDWVCEILSPATARLDRHKKLNVYARAGVTHAWLIDPIERTLEVLRLEAGRWTIGDVHARHECVRAIPFDAVPLPLSHLWDEPCPRGGAGVRG